MADDSACGAYHTQCGVINRLYSLLVELRDTYFTLPWLVQPLNKVLTPQTSLVMGEMLLGSARFDTDMKEACMVALVRKLGPPADGQGMPKDVEQWRKLCERHTTPMHASRRLLTMLLIVANNPVFKDGLAALRKQPFKHSKAEWSEVRVFMALVSGAAAAVCMCGGPLQTTPPLSVSEMEAIDFIESLCPRNAVLPAPLIYNEVVVNTLMTHLMYCEQLQGDQYASARQMLLMDRDCMPRSIATELLSRMSVDMNAVDITPSFLDFCAALDQYVEGALSWYAELMRDLRSSLIMTQEDEDFIEKVAAAAAVARSRTDHSLGLLDCIDTCVRRALRRHRSCTICYMPMTCASIRLLDCCPNSAAALDAATGPFHCMCADCWQAWSAKHDAGAATTCPMCRASDVSAFGFSEAQAWRRRVLERHRDTVSP